MNPYHEFPRLHLYSTPDSARNQARPDTAYNDPLDRAISRYAYSATSVIELWIKRAFRSLQIARRRRESIRALEALSDHSLHDIGIHRSQIRTVVEEAVEAEAARSAAFGRRQTQPAVHHRRHPAAACDNLA